MVSAAQRSNSRDGALGAPSGPSGLIQDRLWVVKPEPTISVPSSRSWASDRPIAYSPPRSGVGIDICRTGTSAAGHISLSGT